MAKSLSKFRDGVRKCHHCEFETDVRSYLSNHINYRCTASAAARAEAEAAGDIDEAAEWLLHATVDAEVMVDRALAECSVPRGTETALKLVTRDLLLEIRRGS